MTGGLRSGCAVAQVMRDAVALEPLVRLDYAGAVDADSVAEVDIVSDPSSVRLLIAAVVGPVRLIDNAPALAETELSERGRPVRHLERIG